jgi:hypothetical protein
MTIKQQLKKREIRDKDGKLTGYKGQVKFTPNPKIVGFAGMIKLKNGEKIPYIDPKWRNK